MANTQCLPAISVVTHLATQPNPFVAYHHFFYYLSLTWGLPKFSQVVLARSPSNNCNLMLMSKSMAGGQCVYIARGMESYEPRTPACDFSVHVELAPSMAVWIL